MSKSIKNYIHQTTNALQEVLSQYEALVNEQITLGNLSTQEGLAKLSVLQKQLSWESAAVKLTPQYLTINDAEKRTILAQIDDFSWQSTNLITENEGLDEVFLSLSNHINHSAIQLQVQVNLALEKAVALFRKTGVISLAESRKVKVEIINQVNNESHKIALPLMLADGQSMHYNYTLVDRIYKETKCNSTIFQRIPQGFLRIATNVTTSDDKRAVNTFIPVDSLVVQTILRGETYRGSAFVVNNWQATAYEPIWIDGRVEGILYVGLREYLPQMTTRISNVKLRKMLENLVDVYFSHTHGSSAIEKLIEFFTHAQQSATANPFIELGLKELTVLLKQIKEQRDTESSNTTQKLQTHPLSIVTDFIQKHLHEAITVETLAQLAHISKPSLYRHFKEQYALSPIDFINHERLTRAVKIMDSTKKDIQVIAQEVGFNNTSYFIKRFHQRYGVTPKQYVKQIQIK
jgi:AraC-like DNA-binding protein/polyhydroxyalkanoate synthesis regulator phasin